jgi:nickel-dependent lactate racemase
VIVKLPFGDDRVNLDLRGMKVRALTPSGPLGRGDVSELVATALDDPLDGPRFAEIARGRSTATVIVPDATRTAHLSKVLPVIVERLRWAGIEGASITVLVANGTHPEVGEERVRLLLGAVPDGVRVLEHDSRAVDNLVGVGELRQGIPLRLHRAAVEAELLVTVGSVRHHYFAGFGGGPKMVFPGAGGYEEIQANHAQVLRRIGGGFERHPGCEPGILEGNPVAEEIMRAADLRPPDCAICLVEGREGGVAWAGAGPWRVAFSAAVERVRRWFETAAPPFDLMVASGGGTPSDSTLIQGHKGLDAACRFLAPGGEILFVAALDGGLGSEEMRVFVDDPRPEKIFERLSGGWIQYGHTTLRLVEKTARHRVLIFSHLDPSLAQRLGFDPVTDPGAIVDGWRNEHPGTRVGVMPGAAVYPAPPGDISSSQHC